MHRVVAALYWSLVLYACFVCKLTAKFWIRWTAFAAEGKWCLMSSILAWPQSIYKPAYSEQVYPSPEIGRVAVGRASNVKIPWGAWLDFSHFHLYGCCRPASGHRGVSERGLVINEGPHQIHGGYKWSVGSWRRVLRVFQLPPSCP